MTNNNDKIYTVVQKGPRLFNIVDANSGVFMNRIMTQGDVVGGPIVVGNRCTIMVQIGSDTRFGMIYSLPHGRMINRYMV